MADQRGIRCAFCGGNAQYIDAQTGEAICLEHSRLEVRAPSPSERRLSSPSRLTIRPAASNDRPIVQTLALYFWNETEMDCFGRTYDMLKLPSLLLCDGDRVVGCLTYSEDSEDDALSIVMMNILPGETPCFACIFGNPGRATASQRYEKGVLPAITHIVASFQVNQAVKILLEDGSYSKGLLYIDAWDPVLERLAVKSPENGCRVCGACTAPSLNERGLSHQVAEPSSSSR